jgi:hypothetical protein
MSEIYDTNEPFDFKKLALAKPIPVTGGNYFIKCLVNGGPLYIQPPKCKTRQGILKTTGGKRYYTDLMFTNEDEPFIRWMENLESHCQQFIYDNRDKWFDGDMELHDIENYFTSPLKIFKSGKFYIARTNISTVLGKIGLKIYDEDEKEVTIETINDKTNVMTILEVQGIKCSTRSFQIELEMKQMMVLKPADLFEKCIFKTAKPVMQTTILDTEPMKEQIVIETEQEPLENALENSFEGEIVVETNTDLGHDNAMLEIEHETTLEEEIEKSPDDVDKDVDPNIDVMILPMEETDGMQEVEFNLEELPETDQIQIKKRNDVYFEMYREARRKAKIARDLALSSYLEVKRIKNTYMLDDIRDSDDSDLEFDEEDDENGKTFEMNDK